ncbi:MAG: hypothetical protein NTY59_13280 [Alphaproteobacteria bacterium]|nr:hypothetical protein [Alphaproteobacteria bacterium]
MEWLLALVVLAVIAYLVMKRRRAAASSAAISDAHHPCPSCAVPAPRTAAQCPSCKRELPEGWAPAAGIAIPP